MADGGHHVDEMHHENGLMRLCEKMMLCDYNVPRCSRITPLHGEQFASTEFVLQSVFVVVLLLPSCLVKYDDFD